MSEPKYIAIPGSKTHELPPLLVHSVEHASGAASDLDSMMVEAEEMLAPTDADESLVEQRRYDLAVQLAERYRALLSHWQWGDSVVEWTRQCEITFENEASLRNFRHPDVWPHAGRATFVALLMDKHVATHGVALEKAVGLRLMFREPSPIRCLSNQFLLYLNSIVADTAYQSWSQLVPGVTALLPPERFHFDVVDIGE
jgi:hypothetical protein